MSDPRAEYLMLFAQRAAAAGLSPRNPGSNWVSLPNLAKGSHCSLSVNLHRIQVNLNNEDDRSRDRIRALFAKRDELAAQIGEDLVWEMKDGVKKSAVRADYEAGFADRGTWDAQHEWGVATLSRFQSVFAPLLLSEG